MVTMRFLNPRRGGRRRCEASFTRIVFLGLLSSRLLLLFPDGAESIRCYECSSLFGTQRVSEMTPSWLFWARYLLYLTIHVNVNGASDVIVHPYGSKNPYVYGRVPGIARDTLN